MFFKIVSIICFLTASVFGSDQAWRAAFEGNTSLANKILLVNETQGNQDVRNKYLILAYSFYRTGDEEAMYAMLENIDRTMESKFSDYSGNYFSKDLLSSCKGIGWQPIEEQYHFQYYDLE